MPVRLWRPEPLRRPEEAALPGDRYLLDADAVSSFRKPRPNPHLVSWISAAHARGDGFALSAHTVFELHAGASYVREHDPARADEIERWIDALISQDDLVVVPVDAAVARVYAAMFTNRALKNFVFPGPGSKRPKSGGDLVLAATSIVTELRIVSLNVRDFSVIAGHIPQMPPLAEIVSAAPGPRP